MSTYRDQFLDFFEICDKYIKIGPFSFLKITSLYLNSCPDDLQLFDAIFLITIQQWSKVQTRQQPKSQEREDCVQLRWERHPAKESF
jgi:hypothetical protein